MFYIRCYVALKQMVKVINKQGKIYDLDYKFDLPKGEYRLLTPKWEAINELFEPDFKGVEIDEDKRELVNKIVFRFETNGVVLNTT